MQGIAAQLTEEDMKNVAAFYGSKQAKPGFAKDKELVALGEKIYRGGIADNARCPPAPAATARTAPASRRSTRACPASMPTTPPAQLVAFRDGARKNSPQMTPIAAKHERPRDQRRRRLHRRPALNTRRLSN